MRYLVTDCLALLVAGHVVKGDVLVVRYEGPKGGPGMPAPLQLTMDLPASAVCGPVATQAATQAVTRAWLQPICP